MSNDFEFGWFVGFFEGEGSIWINKQGYAGVSVCSTDFDSLERFARFIDFGKIYEVGAGAKSPLSKKPQKIWQTQKMDEVQRLCSMLLPHLSERRAEKAREALACTYKPGFPGRNPNKIGGLCRRGHKLTFKNVYIRPSTGNIECRLCRAKR